MEYVRVFQNAPDEVCHFFISEMGLVAHAQLCGYNARHKRLLTHSVSGVQELGN